jgi:hypothetical protein
MRQHVPFIVGTQVEILAPCICTVIGSTSGQQTLRFDGDAALLARVVKGTTKPKRKPPVVPKRGSVGRTIIRRLQAFNADLGQQSIERSA